jgi:hypothetical protein
MRIAASGAVLAAALMIQGIAFAAPFQNLGFDEANTNNVMVINPPQVVGSSSDLLPGWQLYHGTNLQSTLFLNANLDTPFASLIDHQTNAPYRLSFPPERVYAMMFWDTQLGSMPFSLAQQGDIPQDAMFLQWRFKDYPFLLRLNGQNVNAMFPIGIPSLSPQSQLFDVSRFAGQNVELKIATDPLVLSPNDFHFIDSIQFVTAPPKIGVSRPGTNLVVSWPASTTGYVLQSTDALSSTNRWQTVPAAPVVIGTDQVVTTNTVGKAQFFRLLSAD